MRISRKFNKISVLHNGMYYFPHSFVYQENNVKVLIYHRSSRKWFQEFTIITFALAKAIKEYAEKYK